MPKKITYILSNIDKAQAFEWIIERIDLSKFTLSFILLHSQEPYLYAWLKEKGVMCHYVPHYGKKSYISSFFKLLKLLRKIKPEVVHTHLFDANLLGLFTSKLLGIKKRIYTRHHSSYHHEYFPKAIKYDKLTNRLATDIVAISKNVLNLLTEQEQVSLKKTCLIHHGFDLEAFSDIDQSRVDNLKEKYGLNKGVYPIIGVIARYISWKGIQYTIPAFKKLLDQYPNAKLVLANANGPDKEYIKGILEVNLSKKNYLEIAFENDLFALYQLFDVYVHVPVNNKIEAFGQTYVEALAAGIPSVFTLSGVANEFIVHQENALVVNFKDSDDIYLNIERILNDKEFSHQLIEKGHNSIKMFSLNLFIHKLEMLYE